MSVIETGGGVKVTCFKYRQCHDNMPDLTSKIHLHIACDGSPLSWVFKHKTMPLYICFSWAAQLNQANLFQSTLFTIMLVILKKLQYFVIQPQINDENQPLISNKKELQNWYDTMPCQRFLGFIYKTSKFCRKTGQWTAEQDKP